MHKNQPIFPKKPEIDLELIEKINKKKRDTRFEKVYPDEIVALMKKLIEEYSFSYGGVVNYMLEKYEVVLPRGTVRRLVLEYKKTLEKQVVLEQKKPEQPQYPFLLIKPTKTSKKDTFNAENSSRLFVQKDLPTTNEKKEQNTLPADETQNEKTAEKSNLKKDTPVALDEPQQDAAEKTKLENFDSETTVKYEDGELGQNSVQKNELDYFEFESAIEDIEEESEQKYSKKTKLENFDSESTVKHEDDELGQNSVQRNELDKKAKKTSNNKNDNQNYKQSAEKDVAPETAIETSSDDAIECEIIGRPKSVPDEDIIQSYFPEKKLTEKQKRKIYLRGKMDRNEEMTLEEHQEYWSLTKVKYN